jgi:hypothetical protein
MLVTLMDPKLSQQLFLSKNRISHFSLFPASRPIRQAACTLILPRSGRTRPPVMRQVTNKIGICLSEKGYSHFVVVFLTRCSCSSSSERVISYRTRLIISSNPGLVAGYGITHLKVQERGIINFEAPLQILRHRHHSASELMATIHL